MNKGCAFIAGILVLLVLLAGGGAVLFMRAHSPAILLSGLERAIADYREAHPDVSISPENEAWVTALSSSDGHSYAQEKLALVAPNGAFLDVHGNPIRFREDPDGSISAHSAGKDGEFDTADDVSTDNLPGFLK